MADRPADRDSTSDQYNRPSGITVERGTAANAIADIEAYEKEYLKWEQRGKSIIRRYRDERSEATNLRVVTRKFNILWSNTETLKPTLYARLPRVQVERRFKDADPTGRTACEIAERAGNYLLETSPFDNVMRNCVHDLLLPGRAVAWINYNADLSEVEAPMPAGPENEGAEGNVSRETSEEAAEPELEKIHEVTEPIYVDWRDFGHSPKRSWQEVYRAWRVCHMTREELVDRFGEDLGNELPLDEKAGDANDKAPDSIHDTARVYEVWDKKARKVCWVHKSRPDYLDESDPPINLADFWPFPRPIWATLTNDTLVPIPLFILYQDQAAELDKITNRIGRMVDGLKLVGVCDASTPELQRILNPNGTPDNMMIQVSNWAAFAEKGGFKGAFALLPLEEIASTLLSLYSARDQVLNVIYQVTGLADIIRGSSNPNETATAQSIKGQFASLRIKDTQAEVARFSRDAARIMVEMAIELYEPETLYEMVQADQFCKPSPREMAKQQQMQQMAQVLQQMGQPAPPMPPMKPMDEFMAALRMLRDDKLRSFHIDIETDSTIAMNEQEDKQNATEFLTALGTFMSSFGPMVQQMPALAPVAGEALLFATRRYKAGRGLESTIEKAVAQISQMAQQPKPLAPEQIKAEAQAKQGQARLQLDAQKTQGELQNQAKKDQGEMVLKATEQQFDEALAVQEQKHKEKMDRQNNVVTLNR